MFIFQFSDFAFEHIDFFIPFISLVLKVAADKNVGGDKNKKENDNSRD